MISTMKKIRKVLQLKALPDDAIQALLARYPDGLEDHVRKVTKPNGDYFYAVDVETETVSYLVKIEVDVDQVNDEEVFDLDFIDKKAELEAKKHSKSEDDDLEDED